MPNALLSSFQRWEAKKSQQTNPQHCQVSQREAPRGPNVLPMLKGIDRRACSFTSGALHVTTYGDSPWPFKGGAAHTSSSPDASSDRHRSRSLHMFQRSLLLSAWRLCRLCQGSRLCCRVQFFRMHFCRLEIHGRSLCACHKDRTSTNEYETNLMEKKPLLSPH